MSPQRAVSVATAAICAAGATLATAAAAPAAPACPPPAPGGSRTLLDAVPRVVATRLAPLPGGGMVLAFSSYRGSREFPGTRVTVLALDARGCRRWRASLRGGWPIARPVAPRGGSVVLATSATSGGTGSLALTTLSAATGRVLRRDLFASLPLTNGIAPTLLSDRRGDVMAVFATSERISRSRSRPVMVLLSRRAGRSGWVRRVVARNNSSAPAAAARSDGAVVVAYPRRGRLRVRRGSMTGRLGRSADAGPVTSNFRSADLALGADGTVAAVWESTTYSAPWRLRAAVRAPKARRFARSVALGVLPGVPGTLLTPAPARVRVGATGRVTVGYAVPDGTRGEQRAMCVTAGSSGRFGARVPIGGAWEGGGEIAAMLFGPGASAAAVPTTATADGERLVSTVVGMDAACRIGDRTAIADAAGPAVESAIDERRRVWVLGQQRGSVSARRPLVLTIVGRGA